MYSTPRPELENPEAARLLRTAVSGPVDAAKTAISDFPVWIWSSGAARRGGDAALVPRPRVGLPPPPITAPSASAARGPAPLRAPVDGIRIL